MIDIRQLIREEYRRILLKEGYSQDIQEVVRKKFTDRLGERNGNEFYKKFSDETMKIPPNNSAMWYIAEHLADLYLNNLTAEGISTINAVAEKIKLKDDAILNKIKQKLGNEQGKPITTTSYKEKPVEQYDVEKDERGRPIKDENGQVIKKPTGKTIMQKVRVQVPVLDKEGNPTYEPHIKEQLKYRLESYPEFKQELDSVNRMSFSQAQQVATDYNEELSNQLDTAEYSGQSDYEIREIHSFEEAEQYYQYVEDNGNSPWCITGDESHYNSYTENGNNRLYFLCKKGFENIALSKENETVYKESLIAVFVNIQGKFEHITSRINREDIGITRIAELLQQNPKEVLLPDRKKYEAEIKRLKQLPVVKEWENGNKILKDNGKPNILVDSNYNTICKDVYDFVDGLAEVQFEDDRYNWVREDNGQLLSQDSFKWINDFVDGLAMVKLEDNTWNWVRRDNGQLFSQDKFKTVENFIDGLARVRLEDGTWNWLREDNGQIFSQDRFKWVDKFIDGLSKVRLEDYTWNWVRQDNGQLFSQDKFKDVSNFCDGLAIVELEDGTCNWLRQDNGQLLSQDRFYNVYDFKDGLARVIFEDDTYNWVRQDDGQIFSQDKFKYVSNFKDGLAKVTSEDNTMNWVKQDNGQIFSQDRFRYVYDFKDGFAVVQFEDDTWNWVRQDNGQLFSQDRFKRVGDFDDGLASFQYQDNSKGYIDKKGNLYDRNKQPLKQTPTQNNAVQEKLKRVRHLCMLRD